MSVETLDFVKRWWAGFNETGMPSLDLCDEQIRVTNPPQFPVRGTFQGHEGVRRWREQVFEVFEDPKVEIDKLIDAGDGETVVMFLRLQGTAKYTQIEFDEPWAAVWTIRDGRVLHAQGYLSRREALEAAGLSE